jgi:hypothetical protein
MVDNLVTFPAGLLAFGVMLVFLPIWWLLEAILIEVRHTNRVEQSRKTNRDE